MPKHLLKPCALGAYSECAFGTDRVSRCVASGQKAAPPCAHDYLVLVNKGTSCRNESQPTDYNSVEADKAERHMSVL